MATNNKEVEEVIEGQPISGKYGEVECSSGENEYSETSVSEERQILSENDKEKIVKVTQYITETYSYSTYSDYESGVGGGGTYEYENTYTVRVKKV